MLMAVGFACTAMIQFEDDTIDQQEQLLDRNCYLHDTLIQKKNLDILPQTLAKSVNTSKIGTTDLYRPHAPFTVTAGLITIKIIVSTLLSYHSGFLWIGGERIVVYANATSIMFFMPMGSIFGNSVASIDPVRIHINSSGKV